jgi:hypothetical protein
MRTKDAISLLYTGFGPGDLMDAINEHVMDHGWIDMQGAEKMMTWMAEQLTDEEDMEEEDEGN